jgi:hypothetical protein
MHLFLGFNQNHRKKAYFHCQFARKMLNKISNSNQKNIDSIYVRFTYRFCMEMGKKLGAMFFCPNFIHILLVEWLGALFPCNTCRWKILVFNTHRVILHTYPVKKSSAAIQWVFFQNDPIDILTLLTYIYHVTKVIDKIRLRDSLHFEISFFQKKNLKKYIW